MWSSSCQCPAGRVYQYRVGSGRVVDKIPGSVSGSGRVGVFKYTIGYFRVSFFSLGYFRVFWVCRVFLGLPIYSKVIFYHLLRAEKFATKSNWS